MSGTKQNILADEVSRARHDGVTDAGNLPFFTATDGSKAAVLLVHGFGASPWEVRPLAEDMAKRGFASLAVRLPGHGTSPEDLAGTRFEDWLEAVLRGFDLLTAHFPRVYGAGLSTGALLVLALAGQRQPRGAVLLSPYLRLRHCLAPFAGWLRHIKPYQHRRLSGPEASYYYERRPLAGVHQINRLMRHLAANLEAITTPVLAIHGEGDRTVDIDSGRDLVDRLGSRIKVYERLGPETPHVLTGAHNPQRDTVFDLIGKFMEEMEGQSCPQER